MHGSLPSSRRHTAVLPLRMSGSSAIRPGGPTPPVGTTTAARNSNTRLLSLSSLGTALVWVISGVFFITLLVMWSIRRSPAYPVLLAIRDAEPFAQSAGVATSRTKISIFALSAALAAMAGWAFSFLGFVAPSDFGGTASINILVMVILGGMNTLLGPIIAFYVVIEGITLISWVFNYVYTLTRGGPADATQVAETYIYSTATTFNAPFLAASAAAALLVGVFGMMVVFSVVRSRVAKDGG